MITTWRELIDEDRADVGDVTPLVAVAPRQAVLGKSFDSGYGGSEGPWFLAWTESRVYFPVVYDGAEWVGSAPRNPTNDGQPHVGGQ